MFTRSKSQRDKLQYIDEIEAFASRNYALRHCKQKEGESSSSFSDHTTQYAIPVMAEKVPDPPLRVVLGDYVIPQGRKIKTYRYNLILTNQFAGKDDEDPHNSFETFYDLVETIGLDETNAEDAYMKLFHLALTEEAKEWFKTLPSQNLNTWSEVEAAFNYSSAI
jgi:hypothetical protein